MLIPLKHISNKIVLGYNFASYEINKNKQEKSLLLLMMYNDDYDDGTFSTDFNKGQL